MSRKCFSKQCSTDDESVEDESHDPEKQPTGHASVCLPVLLTAPPAMRAK